MSVGFQGHIGIRKEASFASGGAVDNWQPINTGSLDAAPRFLYSDRIRSTAEQVSAPEVGRVVSGSLVFPVTPQGPLQWWSVGLGQAASPYSVARPLSSLLIQLDQETAAVQASGCMIGSMTLSSQEGGELMCSVDIEAKDLASVAAGSPLYTSGDFPYVHAEAVVKLNGVTDTKVRSWSLTVNNSLITDLFGTGVARTDIPAGKLVVTGSFTKLFDTVTERDAFLARGVRSFEATYTRGLRSFDVLCNRIKYNSRPASLTGQSDYIVETFEWTAYVEDPTAEQSVKVTVTQ